jgi:DNA-binding NarL/FixJ family response regulator
MSDTKNIIRTVIVEDEENVRDHLKWLLDNSDGIKCAGVFEDGESAIKGINDLLPDVVLMDIGLPGKSGIQCIKEIKKIHPDIQIIMQTVYTDEDKIFESLQAGAVGYILKKTKSEKIIQAIKDAYEGGVPMTGEIARKVLSFLSAPQKEKLESLLSNREIEVLKALTKGFSYNSIAEQLFISINTVRFHVKNIYAKLHVKSRPEAVAKVIREKLI